MSFNKKEIRSSVGFKILSVSWDRPVAGKYFQPVNLMYWVEYFYCCRLSASCDFSVKKKMWMHKNLRNDIFKIYFLYLFIVLYTWNKQHNLMKKQKKQTKRKKYSIYQRSGTQCIFQFLSKHSPIKLCGFFLNKDAVLFEHHSGFDFYKYCMWC